MTPPGYEFYANGYMLVVHATGSACERIASLVVKKCNNIGVDAVLNSIEEVRLETLYRYTGLFLVVERPRTPQNSAVAELFTKVFESYRERRRDGLAEVLSAGCDWQDAGPIQLLLRGSPEDVEHPAFEVLRNACVVRVVTDHQSVGNLFEVYEKPLGRTDPEEALRLRANEMWQYLQSWKVRSLSDVRGILQIIEEEIVHYSDPRFRKTCKPLPEVSPHNRLELVLFDPHRVPMASDRPGINRAQHERDKKNFTEAGAKVVRETLDRIMRHYPYLERPNGRMHTRDNQAEFKRFYDALLVLDRLPAKLRDRLSGS